MRTARIKFSLLLNYFLFGMLLNSVGIVMLQVQQQFGVGETSASVLEVCKDGSIALTSFLLTSMLPRLRYRQAMLLSLALVCVACFVVPVIGTWLAIKVYFAITGASFALMKTAVLGCVSIVTPSQRAHIRFMNGVEAVFMAGIVLGYFLFGSFSQTAPPAPGYWMKVFDLLGTIAAGAFILLLATPWTETAEPTDDSIQMAFSSILPLLLLPMVLLFLCCSFLYVLAEQSLMSWLPTFHHKVLGLSIRSSVFWTAAFAGSFGAGRLTAAWVLRKWDWSKLLIGSVLASAGVVMLGLGFKVMAISGVGSGEGVPVTAMLLPLIGFFLAPVYPVLNSIILTTLPKARHRQVAALLVLSSALGGSLGSVLTGIVFQHAGGRAAFYMTLLPLLLLALSIGRFRTMIRKRIPGFRNRNTGFGIEVKEHLELA